MLKMFLTLLFCSYLYATNYVFTVYNSISKNPIPNVVIMDLNEKVLAKSDENGKVVINHDVSEIILSHIGYEKKQIKIQDKLEEVYLEPKNYLLKSVVVLGNNYITISPINQNILNEKFISKNYSLQDIPQYLSLLPSVSSYSENGNGIGYNYISIRGFDQRRIAVAVNGVPQNDPEDHNVYWLDMPDLVGNAELLQIQKGAGKSAFGYPAIGGTINIITKNYTDKPYLRLGYYNGSFNTQKKQFEYSSGIVDNQYSLLAKFSNISSNGYRDNSWTNLYSYYVSSTIFTNNLQNTINVYGGIVNDGLAYNGIGKFAIKNKDLRKDNLSYWEDNNSNYTYKQLRRSDEVEHFIQPHYELITNWKINENLKFTNVLFMVVGEGYFDYDGSWGDTTYFRLTSNNGFYPSTNPTNTLIRAWVKNRQYGIIPKIEWKHANGELFAGLEIRKHNSIHFGNINFAENLPLNVTKDYRYYEYKGKKDIINAFVSENYSITDKFSILAELQLAYNKYRLYDEKYIGTDFSVEHTFINPKFGLNYQYSKNGNIYFSFAQVSREPRLKEYYDAAESSGGEVPKFEFDGQKYNFNNPLVKPEKMNDFELGINYSTNDLSISFNSYYMIFKDEIVKNGTLDRFGQPNTGNMPKTLHQGIEFIINYKFYNNFNAILNGNISENKILEGKYFYYNKVTKSTESVELKNNPIAGFPNYLFNLILNYDDNNLFVQLLAKYSGKFYTDNFGNNLKNYQQIPGFKIKYKDNVNDEFWVVDMVLKYNYQLNNLEIFPMLQINNIFNKLYSTNGIGKEFYPAAERNYLIGLTIKI